MAEILSWVYWEYLNLLTAKQIQSSHFPQQIQTKREQFKDL